jgi:hypothetical protein
MFKIECYIYVVNLFDYICRIIQQVYLLEESSVLTPLATAALFLRIIYPFLLKSRFSAFIQQIKAFANIQNSICLYVIFMFVVSVIVAILTMQLENSSFGVEIVKHFTSFSNQNWLPFYQNVLLQHQSKGYSLAIKYALIVLGEVILLKLIYTSGIGMTLASINR